MQARLGVVRLDIAACGAGNVVQGAGPGALVHESAGGHMPVRQLPVHLPAHAHTVEGEHVQHELVRRARLRGAEGLHGGIGRIQHGGQAAAGDFDQALGKTHAAADALCQQTKGLAVDGRAQFDGCAVAARHKRIQRAQCEGGGKAPRP